MGAAARVEQRLTVRATGDGAVLVDAKFSLADPAQHGRLIKTIGRPGLCPVIGQLCMAQVAGVVGIAAVMLERDDIA
ncbi:hypothetical protein AS038_15875 [Arthrobacter sp. NIO-1057]|nr:hypothetical protein AS038_15875 [Arthrobacter sp. NIO-1057]